ncbi:MAG: hypothetical protein AAF591_13795 [Verrucomicrobiota bacterium]
MSETNNYKEVDPGKVLDTLDRLEHRIADRFPDAGLLGVCHQVKDICAQSRDRITWMRKPIWPLRAAVVALLLLLVFAIALTMQTVHVSDEAFELTTFADAVQNIIQDIVYVAVAVFFLVRIERMVKRRRILTALHELRSVAHVIDMHQLTKDPDRILSNRVDTEASPTPTRQWTPFTLRRYLDYCSELLSLTGKIAAIHLKDFDDSTIVAAVNEIEDLTNGLSRKIWQKITSLQSL